MKHASLPLLFLAMTLGLAACAPPTSESQPVADTAQAEQPAVPAQPKPKPKPVEEVAEAPAPYTAPKPAPAQVCYDCGVIDSITPIREKGDGSGAGAVLGGVLGGVLGHQVGGGKGKDVATAVGAIGGAVAGHQAEKQIRATTTYSIGVKMDDGSYRTASLGSEAGLSVGMPVRVVGDSITPR